MHTDETVLSDTQAMLNPVGSQASLSYRIATLQHKVFEDLKAGNLRWFEAVDLHGCTVEEARQAVLQIIQIAKDENQNVIKIVHGKGPEAILKLMSTAGYVSTMMFWPLSVRLKTGWHWRSFSFAKTCRKIQSLNSKRIYPKIRHCKDFCYNAVLVHSQFK